MTRLPTDDDATSWREETAVVKGDERGRSRETRQSTDDGEMRDKGADDAQGKDDAVHGKALEVAP